MSLTKSSFSTFLIAIATIAMASCVPTATEKKANCGASEAFDSVSRSCYSIEQVRRVPVGNAPSQSTAEETPKTITLSYTDANLDKAISCEVVAPSPNIYAFAPVILSGALVAEANLVYLVINNLVSAIPAGANSVSANSFKSLALSSYDKLRLSKYLPTISNQLSIFKANISSILSIGALYPSNAGIQLYVTQATNELNKLNAMITQVNSGCTCSAGVCTTTIIPKLAKNGTAGFSYTVTDKDGTSALKAVGVTITALPMGTSHLKPVAQSSYLSPLSLPDGIYPTGYFNESPTSTPSSYDIVLSDAGDISGTPASAMKYRFIGAKNSSGQGITAKGLVSDCMDLPFETTGPSDTVCTYTPNDGDASDDLLLPAPAKASVLIGDVTFTARSVGTYGNAISVQYYSLVDDNTYTASQKYGLVDETESFVRVAGNAIKIFLVPGVTSSYDIQTLINGHPQANKMVAASGAIPSPLVYPIPSIATATAKMLTGGVNGFDSFSYSVSNGVNSSSNTATANISIVAQNDAPMVPITSNSYFYQSETFLEEESKSVSLAFTDVDNSSGFTVEMKIDSTISSCSTASKEMLQTYFSTLVSSTNFTIGPVGAFTCSVGGNCTTPVNITAGLDFAGEACLYYLVKDPSNAASYVQGVKIVVTNINDTPQLSATALPVMTALGSASVYEDLAPGFNNYIDIFAGPGGDQWEASQLLTVTATSSNTALIPSTSCTNYTPVLVSPIGAIVPTAVGLKQFDTATMRCYISTGTASVNDWKLMPSLTAFPACAYNYYGQGSPVGVVTPSGANKYYLDTTNNRCFISTSTVSSSWKQDSTLSNYKISYVPEPDKSGTTNITVNVKDSGGTANAAVDNISGVLALTVLFVDDPPVFLSTITAIHTNEGGAVQSGAFKVDEDAGSTVDEDSQGIIISNLTTDNPGVLPVSAIQIFYDLNDNGVEDAGEERIIGQVLETVNSDDAKAHSFYLKLDPVDGVSGNANVQLTVSDGLTPIVTNFSFIVHPIAALHGGWNNISSVGIKTDKNGAPVTQAEIKCNYNKLTDVNKCAAGTAACTGVTSPNSTIVPDAANVIFWDSSALRCYRSTGTTAFSWVEMNTSCPITREAGVCSGNNCITTINPTGVTVPSKVGQYNYNSLTNKCYVSTGTLASKWEEYVPAKVTLSWKPYIMVGSGADSAVQIAGWNVYRREANADYNFKNGHLKNTSSTSIFTITDPTIRTFTDTTAIAGKVYYYVVRPVDTIRNFPTYTPETFSEVRVIAAPANYSFVHRWMINQEMCNGMNITTTTTPSRIDQTQNFRCEYTGPGHVLVGGTFYYDFGKDLLVDSQETGCAYAAAPKCSANGCVGIGAPVSTTNVVNDDLYYDRSAGKCYAYSGGWSELETVGLTTNIVAKSSTALNAPLTNITKARAVAICSARNAPSLVPTLSYNNLAGITTPYSPSLPTRLPLKRDYMAYASQKLDVTDPEITEMEQGFSLNIQSRCNGSSASGLDTAFTDALIPSTSFIYSLPGTFSSGIRSLYTGSIPWGSSKGTEACVSRYGIQDLYGNVAEWVNDGITCNPVNKTCTPVPSGSFNGSEFGSAYAFDNVTGPYAEGGDGFNNGTDDAYLSQWTFADELFGAGKFNYPLGMPILDSISPTIYSSYTPWILDIGPSNGITTNKLHEDGIIINASLTSVAKSFAVGGSYLSGNRAGRFSSELIENTIANRPDVGFRCIIPINTADIPSGGDYPDDNFYTYPN